MKTLKNILAASCILFLAFCAKESNEINPASIPEPVKVNFAAEYPGSKDVKWEKEGGYYEAEYEENGMEKSVVYDANGNVIATETEIAITDLPAAVNEYISNNYNGYTIEEAEMEERTDGIFFEVELENENQEIELMFDSEGNFIKQESEDDENEEDDDDEGEDDENEKEIGISELPQVIINAITEQYPKAEILEADEITQKDGSITYDVEINYNGKITELMYDAQGDFLGVEADDDDNEDENDDN